MINNCGKAHFSPIKKECGVENRCLIDAPFSGIYEHRGTISTARIETKEG